MKDSVQIRLGGAPVVLHAYDLEALRRTKYIIETVMPYWPTAEVLCREVGINELKLKVGFKHLFQVTPLEYHIQLKMEAAKTMLRDPQNTVAKVAEHLGYRHVASFCREFKKTFGTTPGHYQRYQK